MCFKKKEKKKETKALYIVLSTEIKWSKHQAMEINNSFFLFLVQIPLNGVGKKSEKLSKLSITCTVFTFFFYTGIILNIIYGTFVLNLVFQDTAQ